LKYTNKNKPAMESVVKAFLVQTLLANHLAPQLRPRSRLAEASSQPSSLLSAIDELTIFVSRITQAVSTIAQEREWDLVDVIDCRLLTSILSIIAHDGPITSVDGLGFPSDMVAELSALWSVTHTGTAPSSSSMDTFLPFNPPPFKIVTAESDAHTPSASATSSLLPIRSTMVDRMVQEDDRPEVKESDYMRWFNEKAAQRAQVASYPWKASRALDFSTILYYDKEYEERRTNKNYSTSFHAAWAKLAQSLDARPTQTAVLQPKVLMKEETTAAQALQQLLTKLELENKPKTALNETRDKEVSRIKSLIISWRGSPLAKRISSLAGFIPTTATANFDWLYALLDVHIEQYRVLKNEKDSAAKSAAAGDSIHFVQQRLKALQRDEIFDQCVSMIVQCGVGMLDYRGTLLLDPASAVMKRLTDIFDQLGLTSLHASPSSFSSSSSTATAQDGQSFPAGEDQLSSAARFQLARMGPWMKRDVGAVSDPRASRLLDSWQIDVLNCIDSYKSTLVVAPTSAGKSFMGFHAMSRVLETEDGVLVYVAPTKALVNQVVAEVYSKFSKANTPAGTVICGAFTRDMRIAPVYARILVTVPQCLEILLMSRELAGPGGWRSKLKWVIFDEIHCINMDDGAVWERLLPLVPCPFMALSATVGDVDRFQKWLESLAIAKQEYASERPPIIFSPAKKEEPAAAGPAAATAKSTKPIHPKLAAKAEKHQQKGGKGKNAKKEAKETAAAVVEEQTSSEASSASTDAVKFPGFVTEPFKFINYPHRYSDLYKYIMVPRFFVDGKLFEANVNGTTSDASISSATGTAPTAAASNAASITGKVQILSELRAMHPWTGLTASRFNSGSPPSSSFSPKECLQVYEAMAKYARLASDSSSSGVSLSKPLSSELLVHLLALKPEIFFGEGTIIDQRMMRKYEKEIKDTFISWSKEHADLAELVLKELTGDMVSEIASATSAGIPLGKDLGSENFLLDSLAAFIEGLKEQSWLPALVFNFDPQFCERLAIALNAAMVEKESSWKISSEYRNARIKYHEEMKEYEAEQKRRERASKKKKDKRNDEDLEKEGDPTMDMPVDPDYELADGTTFTRDGEVEHLDDLKRELTKLKNRGVNGLLVDAIRRGIGVHHSGLDKKYRQAVERHFRTGQIKIVFSTETLALGINMPCRTTVFAGDSPNLTPLQYRQMSGRAGRRGYDPLGRVIFWGIPMHRITYLEGAKLAPIRGQFPLSLSFNLRGLVLGTADVTGLKKKQKQLDTEVSDAQAHPGAKKSAAAAAKAKKASAAKKSTAALAAAPVQKAPKASWDESSDEEEDEEDEEAMLLKKRKAAPTKASWDDSSDDEEDETAKQAEEAAAARQAEPEDEVLVPATKTELTPGATEIFTSIQHVYTHSLYLHQHPDMQSQLDIHTQCSLQYMAKLGLISPLGKPLGLAGLTCHLNWAEPANIVFAKFLSTNILQKMCTDSTTTWEAKVEAMLLLTAHLFSRVPVPPHRAGLFREQLQSRIDQPKHSALHHCNHLLFLPDLPADQQKVIDDHNSECLEVLNTVILPYAKTHRPFSAESSTSSSASSDHTEKWMQLSDLTHLSKNTKTEATSGLFKKVADSHLDVVARSPLAALGGFGDLFTTQADLRTMRHGLAAADFGMLVNEDAHGVRQPLNSYLHDMFKYGNYEWLKKYNMFADADLFANCNEYLTNMRAIRAALFHRSQTPQSDPILKVFSKLIKEFEIKFNTVFKVKKNEFAWITVRGVEGYSGDLQKHILAKTRISVLRPKKSPTLKHRDYIFKIPCRNESDKARLIELLSQWANPEWWIDDGDDSDEDVDEDID